ncbi:hypothetical protein D9M68_974230 [compost metagenome]
MAEHADGEQYLQRQQRTERRLQRRGQQLQVALPGHAQAGAEQHQNHPWHQSASALADGPFHRAHGVFRYMLAHAFEDQHFEEHRADEHQRGE